MPLSKVFLICDAYESGVGHGMQKDGARNPYAVGSDEQEAWLIGYLYGKAKREAPSKENN